ncbi:MAG: PEP-CTERM sorting domain-containing protein [Phycisphaerae bacterium]
MNRILAAVCSSALALRALAASEVLVSSRFTDNILRYNADTGAFLGVFASGPELDNPNGIALGPDGNLYVGLGDAGAILRYHGQTGAFLDTFVPAGSNGLQSVRDIVFGPDGDLYAASGANDRVLRFDGVSGAFEGVAAIGDGLDGPVGLAFSPAGELFVAGALSNRVYAYRDGVFQRSFDAGATHSNAVGLAFNSAGRLLVSQSVTNEVLAFDPLSGAFQGVFASGGLNIPIYMNMDDAGNLWVGSFGNNRVRKFDGLTGVSLGVAIAGGAGGLSGTHDIVFIPEPTTAIGVLAGGALWLLRRRNDAGATSD